MEALNLLEKARHPRGRTGVPGLAGSGTSGGDLVPRDLVQQLVDAKDQVNELAQIRGASQLLIVTLLGMLQHLHRTVEQLEAERDHLRETLPARTSEHPPGRQPDDPEEIGRRLSRAVEQREETERRLRVAEGRRRRAERLAAYARADVERLTTQLSAFRLPATTATAPPAGEPQADEHDPVADDIDQALQRVDRRLETDGEVLDRIEAGRRALDATTSASATTTASAATPAIEKASGPWWHREGPLRWTRGRLRPTALVAALMLTAGLVGWFEQPASTRCTHDAGERACVGLTDGSVAFSTDLAAVSKAIHGENLSTASTGKPWVTVVYLLNMAPGKRDDTGESVRHELEGAAVAQREANREAGDTRPRIRILLAHTGATTAQRDYTLRQIESRRAVEHIVAVAGLGAGTETTRTMIGLLPRQAMGLVATVITSDAITGVSGLVHVAPSVSDEAAAAAGYLRQTAPDAKVLLIQDRNHDDLYSNALGDAFRNIYPSSRFLDRVILYDSSASDQNGYLQQVDACDSAPDAVFFAGRSTDLPRLLDTLSRRPCTLRPLTVMTGDDASQTVQDWAMGDITAALRQGNLRLLYTALAHPGAWSARPQAFDRTAIAAFAAGGAFMTAFPQERLEDGRAVMGYDAMRIATAAVSVVWPVAGGDLTAMGPTVAAALSLLHGVRAVAGASGMISPDSAGVPANKAIPIVELGPDGSTRTLTVTSRTGTPPDSPRSGN
ncbi:hypothetical protein OG689_05020 [Kitasatospora sp. NBC_00240]|uniref:ABC transporter substrate-binding protein n=1 Tax=Kitasatospora sp. NBC_00240 TaxID=2903567 RepID=UPI00225945FC|nr:hypothetical protein [Kitasatospora sp. NBC_00240]MCX5208659.1 hypothetical protein [Kitasatospora sp. NBC_00240]